MKLLLDDEQQSIKDSAKRFFSEVAPITAMRELRDRNDERGFDPAIWQQMSELGFSAITIAEAEGGLGLGYATLGAVFEEAGRTLCASPLFATLVLGASVIELCGSAAQKKTLLEPIAKGQLTATLALDEAAHHAPSHIRCTAQRSAEGYVLNGGKRWVRDGTTADRIIVVARTSGSDNDRNGLSFFLLDGSAPGLRRNRIESIDSRNWAMLTLTDVKVKAEALLGQEGQAFEVLQKVLDRARAVLAAEILGGTLELFDRTVAFLSEREQFGVKIGSFQALRHRAAKLYTEIQLTQSAAMAALTALDDHSADRAALAILAKCRANDSYRLMSNEAIQMHGGMGVTDELDVGLFLKHSRVAIQSFGDSRFLRDQFASAQGY